MTIGDPDLQVVIHEQSLEEWLDGVLPTWATKTRCNARSIDRTGVVVLTATDELGPVGFAVLNRLMAHLYHVETREDRRRRGEVTASGDTPEGQRGLMAWGFTESGRIWTW